MSVDFVNSADALSATTPDLNVTGSDLYIVSFAGLFSESGDPGTPASVEWDGTQELTDLGGTGTQNCSEDISVYGNLTAWGRTGPTAANATLSASGGTYDAIWLGGLAFSGVDQTSPWAVAPAAYSSVGALNETIDGLTEGQMIVTACIIVDGYENDDGSSDITAGPGLTQIGTANLYSDDPDDSNSQIAMGIGAVSGDSFTVEWSGDNDFCGIYMIVGVLKAATGGGSGAALAAAANDDASADAGLTTQIEAQAPAADKANAAGQLTTSIPIVGAAASLAAAAADLTTGSGSVNPIVQVTGTFSLGGEGATTLDIAINGVLNDNDIAVPISYAAFGTSVTSVTDNSAANGGAGNTYTIQEQASLSGAGGALAVAQGVVGGDLTITVHLSATTTATAAAMELTGVTAIDVDACSSGTDASETSHSSSSGSETAQANEVLIAIGHSTGVGNTTTPGSGWTEDVNYAGNSGSGYPQILVAHQVVSVTGLYPFTWSQTSAPANSVSVLVALELSGSPPAGAALAGAASDDASAAGALTTQIPVTGAALSVATAVGALTSGLGLAGSAIAVATATGGLTIQIQMTGAALAESAATAGVTNGILLSAAAHDQGTATGSLTTGSGGAALAGNAQDVAEASGALSTQVNVDGAAADQATAAGALTTGVPLAGAAQDTAQASGTLRGITSGLSGIAQAVASGSGSLTIKIQLSAAALADAQASGTLGSIPSGLAGQVEDTVTATGALSTSIRASGAALAVSQADGNLVTMIPIQGALIDVSAVTGQLTVGIPLTGTAAVQALAAGALTARIQLDGAAAAQVLASGQLSSGVAANVEAAPDYVARLPERTYQARLPARSYIARLM